MAEVVTSLLENKSEQLIQCYRCQPCTAVGSAWLVTVLVSGRSVGELERNSAILVATFDCIGGQTRTGSHLCDTIVCGRSGCAVF